MNPFRLALLTCCVAFPVMAQDVPALQDGGVANANAVADIQARGAATANARAMADTQARATATANATATGSQTGANSVPRTMPPPIETVSPDKPLTHKEASGVTVAQRWIQKFQKPHLDEDGVEHFVSGKGQVFVVAAVDHITDIALSPGEMVFQPLHVGDAASWKFHPAQSRSGGKSISHVLVKPIDAGLSTNLVIETNKRTLSIALTSRQHDYMPLVSLDLAEDDDEAFAAYAVNLPGNHQSGNLPVSACDQAPVVPPDQFIIEGDKASWRPVQVYQVSTDVGIKTCVDFPSNIGSTSLPALLALADDGGWFSAPTRTVVNVRYLNRRFIVDEALSRFVLVDGVGADQKSAKITRRGL